MTYTMCVWAMLWCIIILIWHTLTIIIPSFTYNDSGLPDMLSVAGISAILFTLPQHTYIHIIWYTCIMIYSIIFPLYLYRYIFLSKHPAPLFYFFHTKINIFHPSDDFWWFVFPLILQWLVPIRSVRPTFLPFAARLACKPSVRTVT